MRKLFKPPSQTTPRRDPMCEMSTPRWSPSTLQIMQACAILRTLFTLGSWKYALMRKDQQSRPCQKAHWGEHKQYCKINVEIQLTREALGGWVEERQRTFEKWCDKYSQRIATAALSALEIMIDRGRTGTANTYASWANILTDLGPTHRNARFLGVPQRRRPGFVQSEH